jgi:sulfur-oxidizing protein SoxY
MGVNAMLTNLFRMAVVITASVGLGLLAGSAGAAATGVAPAAETDAAASVEWQQVRQVIFGTRPIAVASTDVLQLEAPSRAEDAATVPIALRSRIDQAGARSVKTAWLIIDRNPSPLAATFRFTSESGRADLETRVRIEQYSFVRAIVELNDGSLHMASRYVKASGGCSAPAGKDPAAAAANLGRMKLSVDPTGNVGEPRRAQLMISHPNTSGLAMDQVTRLYPTPHFVRLVTVRYRDKPVLVADVNFSISENPHFRFYLRTEGAGELKAEVVDTEERKFESRVTLGSGGGT